jgi:hypothetical protein
MPGSAASAAEIVVVSGSLRADAVSAKTARAAHALAVGLGRISALQPGRG